MTGPGPLDRLRTRAAALGANEGRLEEIRRIYDPGGLFAAAAYVGSGRLYEGIGKGAFSLDQPDRPKGPQPGTAAYDAEAEAETRQMLKAKSALRVARGEAPLDIDAEYAALTAAATLSAIVIMAAVYSMEFRCHARALAAACRARRPRLHRALAAPPRRHRPVLDARRGVAHRRRTP